MKVFYFILFSGDEMSLTINSPITGQNFVVPVKAAFRADQCANIELGWSSVLYFIAAHYQSLLFIIASCIVCVIITKFVSQAANKPRFALFYLRFFFAWFWFIII